MTPLISSCIRIAVCSSGRIRNFVALVDRASSKSITCLYDFETCKITSQVLLHESSPCRHLFYRLPSVDKNGLAFTIARTFTTSLETYVFVSTVQLKKDFNRFHDSFSCHFFHADRVQRPPLLFQLWNIPRFEVQRGARDKLITQIIMFDWFWWGVGIQNPQCCPQSIIIRSLPSSSVRSIILSSTMDQPNSKENERAGLTTAEAEKVMISGLRWTACGIACATAISCQMFLHK